MTMEERLADGEGKLVARARELIQRAERIVVLTGAGISAESGVPTFRGADGLWKKHRAEELATPSAFDRDPRLVWEWYGWRRERVGECLPNAGHLALADLALGRDGVTIVTQNVDGLHSLAAEERAAARQVPPGAAVPLELHGCLFRVRCTRCSEEAECREKVDAGSEETLPHCGSCGALLRPDIVWFGEALPRSVLNQAFSAAEAADLCLVVGTSALVHPAASIPVATRDRGGHIVEVNPEPTPLSDMAGVRLRAGAATVLPSILGDYAAS